jgi:hypothetical protein
VPERKLQNSFKCKWKIPDFMRKTMNILTAPIIHPDRHPYIEVFRGLEFESHPQINEIGSFRSGTI